MHDDRFDAQLAASPLNPEGDFASIGYKNFLKHFSLRQSWLSTRQVLASTMSIKDFLHHAFHLLNISQFQKMRRMFCWVQSQRNQPITNSA
jgi:hypothetical protein